MLPPDQATGFILLSNLMRFRRFGKFNIRHLASAPFIYSIIVPVVLLDIVAEIYHRICFPLYRIPYVKRSAYIRIDRHKLSYLDPLEKLNCMYCGYVNGFLAYAVRIAGDTEAYWCGIQHQQTKRFQSPSHHRHFLPYGDEQALQDYLQRDISEDNA